MNYDLCIIGALEEEVEKLISMLQDSNCACVSGMKFYTGTIYGKKIAVAKCGVGKVFAAACAEAMILKYSPRLLVNTGVGGALDKRLDTCDIVFASKLCQHDMDTSPLGDPKGLISGINKIYFDADERAVEILDKAATSIKVNHLIGTVASGDKFVASSADKDFIRSEFSAVACEMEGGAIAHVAYLNSTPVAVIRAISDRADGDAGMDYPSFLPIASRTSTELTLALIKEY